MSSLSKRKVDEQDHRSSSTDASVASTNNVDESIVKKPRYKSCFFVTTF